MAMDRRASVVTETGLESGIGANNLLDSGSSCNVALMVLSREPMLSSFGRGMR